MDCTPAFRRTLLWLFILCGIKLTTLAVSWFSLRTASLSWVPSTAITTLAIAGAFILSSVVFLIIAPRVGIASSAAYGALTFYGAVTSLVVGQHVAWSLLAGVTGLTLAGLALRGWRQLSTLPRGR